MDYSAMDFRTAFSVLVTVFTGFAVVGAARWIQGRIWARSLVAFRVRLPDGLDIGAVSRTLAVVAGSTRRRPIVFETVGTHRGISHFLLVAEPMAPGVVTTVTATLAGVRLEEAHGYLSTRPRVRLARELGVSRSWRPLATDRAADAAAGVLSALYPLNPGELVRVQWTLRARGFVRPVGDVPPEMVRDFRLKQSAPLVDASGRVAVTAPHRKRAGLLLWRVLSGVKALDAPGAAFSTRLTPTQVVAARRVAVRAVPLLPWPCVFNTGEAAALLAYPTDGLTVPGLVTGSARPLPVPAEMNGAGLVVGESNYPGMAGLPLTLRTRDRLRHVSLHGPTGVGKSELLGNMIRQDIDNGHGVVVIDPKSDLVSQILSRIPKSRTDDVIVLDASATKNPVGFNPLNSGSGEHGRELSVDRMVYVMSNLWRGSWGPRTADVLRSGLLTLVHSTAGDGSPFTLAELPELLTNSDFRAAVLQSKSIPTQVRSFWNAYEEMSDAERIQVIGPAMNKIRAFTSRTSLRLMLGQSQGIDLGSVFRDGKILLVPLAKGVIGPDSAHLLGSLLVAMMWQEATNRAAIAPERRRPVFAYIDEFQEFLRFGAGDDIAEMLAQSRSFGLGLVLAHQYLDQLPADVAGAVLGTVRTQIAFQMEYRDARTMAHSFSPLEVGDLSGLDAYEIAMRPCVRSRTLSPVTGRTLQLPEPARDGAALARYSLARYGTPRAHVDEACRMRTDIAPSIEENGKGGGRQHRGSEAL